MTLFAHPALAADAANRDAKNLAALIDSTALKAALRDSDVMGLCQEARALGFRAVCVPPCYVAQAAKALAGSGVRVCTVVGFPNGYSTTATKCAEAAEAIAGGAHEIDFVQNLTWVKAGAREALADESRRIVACAGATGGPSTLVKVILETSLLDSNEITWCTTLHAEAGVHIVKTSTGFGTRGASEDDVRLMASALAAVTVRTGVYYGIKASGGVRTRAEALRFVEAGATRLGTSSGAILVSGGSAPAGSY